MTEHRYTLREGAVAWQQVDGEAILLDLTASTYLGANPAGSALWSALAAGATRDELAGRLREMFDVSPARAAHDVDVFLSACAKRGFLAP